MKRSPVQSHAQHERSHSRSLPVDTARSEDMDLRVSIRSMWSVEDHLRGKSDAVRALFNTFEELIDRCGPSERSVTKTAIAYAGSVRGFAGVTPRRDRLAGFLDLTEELHEAPFTRVTPYTKRLWVHRFVVDDLAQLDRRFAERIAQAYAVGQGSHRDA